VAERAIVTQREVPMRCDLDGACVGETYRRVGAAGGAECR
jgi:hypothetical protein